MDDVTGRTQPEASIIRAPRDYADIIHLADPSVIERVFLSKSREERVQYVLDLLTSGFSKFVLAGPKVAVTLMAQEALTNLINEVSGWIRGGRIPKRIYRQTICVPTWVGFFKKLIRTQSTQIALMQ